MKEVIAAKVKIDFDDPSKTQVLVRKAVFDEDGLLSAIYGLAEDGRWLRKPVGGPYPDECHLLPVIVYDNFSETWGFLAGELHADL